ncbi:PepSY domain-containing protein [Luteimonas sp. RIT-PG2_3]|jgi:uncharacterized membrane protein YkoI
MTRTNRLKMTLLAMGLTVAAGTALAQDAQGLTSPQVRAQLEAQGYTDVHDIEFKNGVWEVDAKSADGKSVDLRIDPKTGEIYPDKNVTTLSEADVRAKLSTEGYTDVHDVKFDDGMWKAEGNDAAGKKVEVLLDPNTGRIVGKEKD